MDNLFGSTLNTFDAIQRAATIAPIQMQDGTVVENPNVTAARQATQQPTQTAKSKTLLYVMIGGAVILAGVLIFIILKRK